MFSQKQRNIFKGKRYYTDYQAVKVFHEKKEKLKNNTLLIITLINAALLIANFIINNFVLDISIESIYFYLGVVTNSLIGIILYKKILRKMREDYIKFDEN